MKITKEIALQAVVDGQWPNGALREFAQNALNGTLTIEVFEKKYQEKLKEKYK